MKELRLFGGQTALVDDEDYELLSNLTWYEQKDGYARANIRKGQQVLMHRFIMNAPSHLQVDHINRKRLDNRRANLRLCTQEQNHQNRTHTPRGTSKYRGVHWDKQQGKWRVHISVNGRTRHVGRFKDEMEAVQAYNRAAREHFGEFAALDNP